VLKIRLQRTGRENRPFYRIVVAEHARPVKGKFIDDLGFYDPLVKPWSFKIDMEKVAKWISKGAQPTNTIARLMKAAGTKDMEKFIIPMKDRKPKGEKEKEAEGAKPEEAAAPAAEKKEEK
jgi:small subunit ribosomal protein S16